MDLGITAVVQSFDAEQQGLIESRLAAEGVLRLFLPIEQMTRYRYLIDIDGNSASWNLFMKLRLGCCILRVESPWEQWCHDRLHA